MSVEFNVSSPIFETCLNSLSTEVTLAVISKLESIEKFDSWTKFEQKYDFQELGVAPIDTHPGAEPYYFFVLQLLVLENGQRRLRKIMITARYYGGTSIECATVFQC